MGAESSCTAPVSTADTETLVLPPIRKYSSEQIEEKRQETEAELLRIAKHPSTRKLAALQKQHPFLRQPTHILHDWVKGVQDAVRDGEDTRAEQQLGHLAQGIEQEEKTLEAAFNLFVPRGKDVMTSTEVKTMLEYLGFPSADSDVETVLRAVDENSDNTMSLPEFHQYVGTMGGSFRLFEVRRQQMANRHGRLRGSTEEITAEREAMLVQDLKAAGIMEQEQAYWKLVLPRAQSEFVEAGNLVDCQRKAIRHIRMLAKSNHEQALPELQRKMQRLEYTDNDLWMTLAYIRELAPILVHINLKKMLGFMENDTHYRNQFETSSSGGLLKPKVREKWEADLFGGSYNGAEGFNRCKYGVLNAMNDYRGVVKCAQYGDSYLVLRDIRLRCTFSPEDSANLKAERLAVLDYYGHVLNEYSEEELKETVKIAKHGEAAILGDSSKVGNMKYKEAQLHGEVKFDKHVERLVAHPKHRSDPNDAATLKRICAKHGWQFSWMDEERNRMAKEETAKLGEEAWKEKLKAIMEKGIPDVKGVPEGFCKKGCGRKVQPGVTSRGNPYTTCCRGCALGFGHDMTCNSIDPAMIGPGLCVNGCGRPVSPGLTAAGRPWTTCCKGCARGYHTPFCGMDMRKIRPGCCKLGCGNRVAPPYKGRKFDTCCVKCAKSGGKEHDVRCLGPPTEDDDVIPLCTVAS